MRPARLLLLSALLLAGPSGCLTWFVDPMGWHAAFDDTQRQYTNCLRWGEVEKASSFVDPESREEFLKHAPTFENLHITDFELGVVDYRDLSATITVTYTGYSLETLVERKIREQQEWVREANSSNWRVRSNVAVFAQAFEKAQR